MKRNFWKLITVILLIFFLYDLYDFIKLFNLNLLDTPNWLNISNLVASGLLLLLLSSYAFNFNIMPFFMYNIIVFANLLLLLVTHYYEYRLGGYQYSETIFVLIINIFVFIAISSTVLKHGKSMRVTQH